MIPKFSTIDCNLLLYIFLNSLAKVGRRDIGWYDLGSLKIFARFRQHDYFFSFKCRWHVVKLKGGVDEVGNHN